MDVSVTGYTGHGNMPTARRKSSPITVLRKTTTQIRNGENYLSKPMEKQEKKIKKYRKGTLRKRLEKEMLEYWKDPTIKVTPMDFSRMLRAYCERFNHDEAICRTRTLEESVVDSFSSWLGYPLR